MILPLSLLAFALASAPSPALAQKAGDIDYVGDTLVSAMMVSCPVVCHARAHGFASSPSRACG
jgi:hypothetical protein